MPSGSGHGAVCTEPSLNHDHDSSAANASTGANSRSSVDERDAQRERGGGLADVGAVVRALLDELEVVVAERPEERLGDLERAGVVVRVERLRRVAHDAVERREHATRRARA